ncbi:helix-turn-helix domain-containing protein [Methylobacterium sp. SI9]|uniref:helix-turn-helix domain-containing protein n=1 Tax=Methylobacterium guangdongense TaxID=3138811 RepID=UPI00313F28E0
MAKTADPRTEARAAVIARYGSEAAALLPCDRERALREATWHLVMTGSPETGPSLMGWRAGPIATMPPEVRREVSAAIPLPVTLIAAETEAAYWRERAETRAALDGGPLPVWVRARLAFLDGLTGIKAPPVPPPSPSDAPAAAAAPAAPVVRSEPAPAAEGDGEPEEVPESGTYQDPPDDPKPVQPGQQPRTREEARAAVRALLGEGLTDREIARRVDVSPSTVAAVRKASACPATS